MADTKDTKDAGDDLIGGTKYVSLAEYKDLLESCHNLEQRLAEKTKILHKKKRFESVAIMLALWGTTALVLSECDYRRNSGSAPVDNGNAGAGRRFDACCK